MIEIVYHKRTYCLEVRGHAGGKRGTDTVCAAVTALVGTLHESLKRLKEQNAISHMESRLESGDAEIKCIPKSRTAGVVGIVFDTICIGLQSIADAHPKKVKMRTI